MVLVVLVVLVVLSMVFTFKSSRCRREAVLWVVVFVALFVALFVELLTSQNLQ